VSENTTRIVCARQNKKKAGNRSDRDADVRWRFKKEQLGTWNMLLD